MDMSQTEWKRTGEKYSQLNAAYMTRPYVMSKISYFIVRTFDVKHHAAHGTI
jgi:hypothetical protein